MQRNATCFEANLKCLESVNTNSKHLTTNVCERIRTPDLLVRSQTLYPAELRTHFITHMKYILHATQNILSHQSVIVNRKMLTYIFPCAINTWWLASHLETAHNGKRQFVVYHICKTGDWSNGMIGVSKTFGGSSILSSPAKTMKAHVFACAFILPQSRQAPHDFIVCMCPYLRAFLLLIFEKGPH